MKTNNTDMPKPGTKMTKNLLQMLELLLILLLM